MEGTIIIADDDVSIRTVLTQAVSRAGCRVKSTGAISTLWRWIEEGEGDAVILDVVLPDGDALDILPALKKKRPDMPVIVISANNTILTTIRASESGAYEYFPKPFDIKKILSTLNKALLKKFSNNYNPEKIEHVPKEFKVDLPLIGRSQSMQEVYRVIARLINTDLTVMIIGASGTGKELVARALHDFGKRKEKPFIVLNLGSIPSDQVENELFGNNDNDINNEAIGKFQLAKGGTLFIDEVADMPMATQTRLLRILQDEENLENDNQNNENSNVRIITSTQVDLKSLIENGEFREDLFFRLNVIPLNLPLLRERAEDIPELCNHFLKLSSLKEGLTQKTIVPNGIEILKKQQWRGNIRELKNFIQRLVVLSPDDIITEDLVKNQLKLFSDNDKEDDLSVEGLSMSVEKHLLRYFELHGSSLPPPGLYNRILKEIEYPLIALSLNSSKGNQLKASKLLGINRNTLRKKINELDINVSQTKKMM